MKIAVLGAGRMAEVLVPAWIAAGHDMMIGGRTASRTQALAQRQGARTGTLREAAQFGEVVMLAVLYAGIESTLREAGAAEGVLRGKVLIDCNNPVEVQRFTLVTEPGTSLAEHIAAQTGARVVKALNQAHFHVWQQRARYAERPPVVPIAGDEDAKEIVAALVRDASGEPLDAGGIEQAHNLEAMAAVIIRILFGGADSLSAFQLTVGTPAGMIGSLPAAGTGRGTG
jgi:8-hydroxy-5-deazaflavin:NADPH oxidoreductase